MAEKKQSGRARREAQRRARERRKRIRVASFGLAAVVVVAIGVFVAAGGSSDTSSEVAEPAPAFALERFGGGEAALRDYLDKPIAVTFMHTW